MDAFETRQVVRRRAQSAAAGVDMLVAEGPLEIRIGDVPIAVVMRTPGEDEALARGFCLTEGIFLAPEEVDHIHFLEGESEGDRLVVVPREGITIDAEQFRRNIYTSSSCGVCGKASIDAVRVAASHVPAGRSVPWSVLAGLPERMLEMQPTFDATGGLHAAALFGPDHGLLAVSEDIGRHNAVDKVIGKVSQTEWPLHDDVLMVSGRISFEIVQKAAVAGVPIVCGVSAASTLAVDLAEELGQTVVGFLRNGAGNIYSGAERIS